MTQSICCKAFYRPSFKLNTGLLRTHGFISGLLWISSSLSLKVFYIGLNQHRLSYRSLFYLDFEGRMLCVLVNAFRIDPVSYDVVHVECKQLTRLLICVKVPVLFYNADKCPLIKSGKRIKVFLSTVSLLCSSAFFPNYIKVNLECCVCTKILLSTLCVNGMRCVHVSPARVIAVFK